MDEKPRWSRKSLKKTLALMEANEAEKARRLARYDEAIQLLRPFAEFAEKFNAKPLGGLSNQLYGIHTGTQWEASINLSDLRAALAFLAAEPKEGEGGR